MALVLTRRLGESVLIGDDIKVTIVSSQGNQVKVAFEAPKDVVILRQELLERYGSTGNGNH